MAPNSTCDIHFGTDGWRAIIGEDFTDANVVRVVDAAAQVFAEEAALQDAAACAPTLYIGHDCRKDAHHYAELAAKTAAAQGFNVVLTEDYCPTPALCWSVAHDPQAVGGIMLTSSHNPAEYLGVKLRMADGGASPKEFTDRVEAIMGAVEGEGAVAGAGAIVVRNLMPPYLKALASQVDVDAIRNAGLSVVIDPLYGAGRHYLADLLRSMGVTVTEIHNEADPSFAGLHPEPIQPWVNEGLAKVAELKADALFINDGDADRIAAGSSSGAFVNPHRIITLVTENLAKRNNRTANKVVSTVTASQQLANACKELGLEYVTTPVGFKWIYGEMAQGGVLVGGEESGGIGLPGHVMERDGLLMALLLTEMMAKEQANLGELVEAANNKYGAFEFSREGLELSPEEEVRADAALAGVRTPEEICGFTEWEVDARDGRKFMLANGSWVMLRKSGTEPLVRIYAEAPSQEQVAALLEWARTFLLA